MLFGQINTPNMKAAPNTNNSDSLLNAYAQSVLSIEALDNPLDSKNLTKDSLKLKNRSILNGVNGQIEIGYEYGLLTGYFEPENIDPLSVLNTRGNTNAEMLGLPFQVSYNYSTMKNPLGVNNYFRVSLDTKKLSQKAVEKQNLAKQEIDNKIQSLESQKGDLSSKLGMGEVLMQKMKRELNKQKVELENAAREEVPTDTLSNNDLDKEVVHENENYQKLKERYDKTLKIYDSIQGLYEKVRQTYELYERYQSEFENRKNQIDGLNKESLSSTAEEKAFDNSPDFLNGVKTLDIGLTYPQTSALSNNSIPIQGIHIETEHGNWYTSISSGVTMNNLMVSTDVVQNKLTNSQNLFNQFDFQNFKEQGLITSVKTGYGKKSSTHVYLGMRYFTQSIMSSETDQGIPSLGAELDVRWDPSFSSGTTLEFVYGKTSYNDAISNGHRSGVWSSMFSADRTNTSLIRVTQQVKPIRTEVAVSSRWIDPYADVRSIGVVQPNNQRQEIRTNTSLTKRLKFGLNYRRDANNTGRVSDTTIQLNVIGGQVNGQIVKGVNYFLSLNYLLQQQSSALLSSRQSNYLIGAGISAEYKLLEVENAINFSYNDYLITDTISTGFFRNISLQNITKLNFGTNSFTLSYFHLEDAALDVNSSFVIGDELTITRERGKLVVGMKVVESKQYGSDFGGKLGLSCIIRENLEWSLTAEKLVLGDFYNYFGLERFQRFPYMIMTRINILIQKK